MPGLDNKISNIIGTAIPTWLLNQLKARSEKGTVDVRDDANIIYLANKSAWVRLVSSINIAEQDIPYFQRKGAILTKQDDLAKNYVLFGGMSKYRQVNNSYTYDFRSGLNNDGAYNLLKNDEVNQYGYRPMPGITNVSIETQGTLGSIRGATINFKVWDKEQLDIMDALYFKLGFSMFLEWGHTYFYHSTRESPNIDPNNIYTTEDYSIDPFQQGLTKEEIYSQISKNVRNSEGNYDAMLGLVTNFNFTYNESGGFDCSLKLMALGYLGDRIKINHPSILPDILEAEIKRLNSIKNDIEAATLKQQQDLANKALAEQNEKDLQGKKSILEVLYKASGTTPTFQKEPVSTTDKYQVLNAFGLSNSNLPLISLNNTDAISRFKEYDFLGDLGFGKGITLYSLKYGVQVPQNSTEKYVTKISLNPDVIKNKLFQDYNKYLGSFSSTSTDYRKTLEEFIISQGKNRVSQSTSNSNKYNEFVEVKDVDTLGYKYTLVYTGANGKTYSIKIQLQLPYQNPTTNRIITYSDSKGVDQKDKISSLVLYSILAQTDLSFTPTNFTFTPWAVVGAEENSTINPRNNFYLELRGAYPINIDYEKTTVTTTNDILVKDTSKANVKYSITINDTALISDIQPNTTNQEALFTDYIKRIQSQNQQQIDQQFAEENPNLFVNPNQIHNSIELMSSLEVMLRTIQVHSLGAAIKKTNDIDIKKEVYVVDLTKEIVAGKSLAQQILSEGVLSPYIVDLINNNVDEKGFPKNNRLAVFAKYGFNSALLASKTVTKEDSTGLKLLTGKHVDYKSLLTSFVVPYQTNQSLTDGTTLNHPVYIQLGTLLMMLNHMCTIYDTPDDHKDNTNQTPLVYIDFNPETNFCLSTNKHLSTNPFYFLIPFEGTFNDYKSLFDNNLLSGNNIIPVSGSTETTPLFNPETDDALSGQIPRFKYDEKSTSGNTAYKGKIMKALVNIDYLLQLVKQYSQKNDTNNVYLKPFLEQLISDFNKYLGNFNTFRLAYNDSANTFYIVDDQLTPGDENEDFISPDNQTEIPLYGLKSIAKNLEIKTDISTKLSNMIAISANSNPSEKAALSTNGSDFGFINTGYKDRYINNRTDVSTTSKDKAKINDTVINSVIRFNQTVADFYSTINPSNANVDHATNYYIQKMSKIKNEDPATRASAMIPVSVNFTTDGISGMNMGQGFTISENFLPYTYNVRTATGIGVNSIQKVGFVVLGLQHTLENNQWNTSVRANMIYLKRISDFNATASANLNTGKQFGVNPNNLNNPAFNSYNNLTNTVVNPQFITGVTVKPGAITAPVQQRIVNIANDIFKAIQAKDPSIQIRVTSGNDQYHQEITAYKSKHTTGQAIDFAIASSGVNPPTQNMQLVLGVLANYRSLEPSFGYINEYDPANKGTANTGGHFHIYYS